MKLKLTLFNNNDTKKDTLKKDTLKKDTLKNHYIYNTFLISSTVLLMFSYVAYFQINLSTN